jgi:hypothetical protein
MKGLASYMILPEFRLILECCKGQASVNDAILMKKAELSDRLYNVGYNIIVDFRKFETPLDSTINESVTNFLFFLKGLNMNCRIAMLTEEPPQVVISMILKELSTDLGTFRIEVFSTVEAALKFLGFTIENYDLIESKIIELNNKTI